MAASGSLPSWVWLLLALGLIGFAVVWSSQDEPAGSHPPPSQQEGGRLPLPAEGDFSNVRRERPIQPREAPSPSIVPPQGITSAPQGAAGSAAAPR